MHQSWSYKPKIWSKYSWLKKKERFFQIKIGYITVEIVSVGLWFVHRNSSRQIELSILKSIKN